jgi:lipopolysaccharide transport system permease protein
LIQSFEHKVTARQNYLSISPREIWAYRDMLYFLVLRDFKIRFKQSLLGVAWAILQPLMMTIVFTIFIGGALNVEFEGPYPLFFLCGQICWSYISKLVTNGTTAMVSDGDLIKKVYFPRLILQLSQVLSNLTDMVIALLIFFSLCLWYQWPLSENIVYFPLFVFMAMLLGSAVSLWLGPLNIRFRDVQIVLPFLIQLIFISSPIMYPLSQIQSAEASWLSQLYQLNPVVGIVEGFRYSLLGNGDPFTLMTIISFSLTFITFLGGVYFFNANQTRFADII